MGKIKEEFITEQGKRLLRHKLREKINKWSYAMLNAHRNLFLKEKGWDEQKMKEEAKKEVIKSLGLE